MKACSSQKMLSCICTKMSTLGESQKADIGVYQTALTGVRHEIVDYVTKIMKYYLDIACCTEGDRWSLFSHVIIQQQEKIDKHKNNMVHLGAKLAPFSQLDLKVIGS